MQLQFTWSRFDTLSVPALYEILQARESVFVVEQQCAYQEADGLDACAWHLTGRVDGALAACARVIDPGRRFEQPSIGRVMTLAAYRQHRLGHPLMREAIAFTERQFPGLGIRISAQQRLQAFYGSLGFAPTGQPYDEDGIVHIDMVRSAG